MRDLHKARPQTLARYIALFERFDKLYHVDRVRYDDVCERLEKEFFMTKLTVEKVLSQRSTIEGFVQENPKSLPAPPAPDLFTQNKQ